jgi:hypothetical protein
MMDDDLLLIVECLERIEAKQHSPVYDGVMGTLPEWIPENFHVDFHAIRGRLLEAYSHAALLGYIAEYLTMDESTETHSIPGEIMRDVSLLAHYREAVRLGQLAGLALLTDNEHAGQVIHGKKFPGRKPGSIGPVRKFIRARLAKNHAATNEELWDAIKAKPPKGWMPMDTTKFGRYIDGPPGSDEVKWKSFCTYAAAERKLLKIHD